MNEYTEYRIVVKPYNLNEEIEYYIINNRDGASPNEIRRELDKLIGLALESWECEYIHIEKRWVHESNWHGVELHDPIFGDMK